jgi:hypothetical protein
VHQSDIFADFFNVFCLLSAKVTFPGYHYFDSIFIPFSLSMMIGLLPAMLFSSIGAENLANLVMLFVVLLTMLNPIRLMNLVIFLYCNHDIFTVGLKGLESSESIDILGFFGFTGLMYNALGDETYFLGSSLAVV